MKIPEALKTKKAKEAFETILFIGLLLFFIHTDKSPAKPVSIAEYCVVGLLGVSVAVLLQILSKRLWKH